MRTESVLFDPYLPSMYRNWLELYCYSKDRQRDILRAIQEVKQARRPAVHTPSRFRRLLVGLICLTPWGRMGPLARQEAR